MRYLLALCCGLLLAGCAVDQGFRGQAVLAASAEPPGAPVQPDGAFVPTPRAPGSPRIRFDYGGGGCEPRFADGTTGTCINNKPCNGFGFKNKGGELACGCFAVQGGCPEGSVCNVRKQACTPRFDIDRTQAPPR